MRSILLGLSPPMRSIHFFGLLATAGTGGVMRRIDSTVQETLGFAEIGEAFTVYRGMMEYMNAGTFFTPSDTTVEGRIPGEVSSKSLFTFSTNHCGGFTPGINGYYITHDILLCLGLMR